MMRVYKKLISFSMNQTHFANLNKQEKTNHNSVWMITFVRSDLSSNRHTFNTEIKIRTDSTLYPNFASNVFLAIITVVFPSSLGTLNCLHKNNVFELKEET